MFFFSHKSIFWQEIPSGLNKAGKKPENVLQNRINL